MKRNLAVAAVFLCTGLARIATASELRSPDGNLVLTVDLRDIGTRPGCPVYRLTYKGREILRDSGLGLDLDQGPLADHLEMTRETPRTHDSTWQPVCGERSVVRDRYNEFTVDLRQTQVPHRQLRLTFRAYDEGVAFSYTLPAQETIRDFVITSERTRFRFTADHPTWPVYHAQGSYDGPVPLSQLKPGAERPLTVRVADDAYIAITEAKAVDYARMKLRPATDEPNALDTFLNAENDVAGKVAGTAPFTTPWRVILVADTPGRLLERNDLIANLNDPCAISDTSWIKPGKVIRETTLTTDGAKACIDFCVSRGLQYIEFDTGWYGKETDDAADARAVDPNKADRLDMHEIVRYGNQHGVGVILYVNRRALDRQADEIFPIYEQWGVKGVKFGFVDVGSQQATAQVHQWIRKAAEHHLMVDIHDEFRDTGYRRTYPNLMTVEGIRGNEEFPSPAHNAALPFTRYLAGPGDYTYCWYSPKLKVTHAHQLALSTIYFSPWQFLFWYDKPAAYDGDPALDYWKHLPTCWDETRVLAGDIGQRVSVARRHGSDWFVGTVAPDGRGAVDLRLSFLEPGKKYTAHVCRDPDASDANPKAVKIETIPVDSTTTVKATMPPNGGHAMHIVPIP